MGLNVIIASMSSRQRSVKLPYFESSKQPLYMLVFLLPLILLYEAALYSKELGVAGRADLIGEWMGTPVILDFKTSARPKKEKWIDNYFMQGAGYAKMYEEMTGVKIEHMLILVAVAGDIPSVQYFPAAVSDWVQPLQETIEKFHEEERNNG